VEHRRSPNADPVISSGDECTHELAGNIASVIRHFRLVRRCITEVYIALSRIRIGLFKNKSICSSKLHASCNDLSAQIGPLTVFPQVCFGKVTFAASFLLPSIRTHLDRDGLIRSMATIVTLITVNSVFGTTLNLWY